MFLTLIVGEDSIAFDINILHIYEEEANKQFVSAALISESLSQLKKLVESIINRQMVFQLLTPHDDYVV